MSSTETSRVAILFWEGYVAVAPSLINAARMLAREGFVVDIIFRSPRGGVPDIPALPSQVRLLECYPLSLRSLDKMRQHGILREDGVTSQSAPGAAHTVGTSSSQPRKVLRRLYLNTILLCDFLQFLVFGLQSTAVHRYAAIIGVDMYSVMPATVIGRIKNAPVLYWSLELHLLRDFEHWLERLFRTLARWCSRAAELVITQDEHRAKSLVATNALDSSKVILVPNSPMGPPYVHKCRYFHEKFDLQPEQRLVLHIGMIHPATFSLELATAAVSWRSEYCLVLHERAKISRDDPYISQIDKIGKDRVFLSLDPVPLDDLDMVVSSGDVGIVLYREESGPNFAQIAGASGKLGYYLRCGLPVICLELPGFKEIIEGYECGICIQDVEEIASALDQIFEDRDSYRANAIKCYQERYEFGRHFQAVLARIEAMDGKRHSQT